MRTRPQPGSDISKHKLIVSPVQCVWPSANPSERHKNRKRRRGSVDKAVSESTPLLPAFSTHPPPLTAPIGASVGAPVTAPDDSPTHASLFLEVTGSLLIAKLASATSRITISSDILNPSSPFSPPSFYPEKKTRRKTRRPAWKIF